MGRARSAQTFRANRPAALHVPARLWFLLSVTITTRCISPFQGFGLLALHSFYLRTGGFMCAMVPIGAAVWSKKTAQLAALAAYLVLSTVSLGCRVKMKVSISYISAKHPL